MMRCAPSISIVAQSVCMELILPPENATAVTIPKSFLLRADEVIE
jgi:hypothetical protein